MSNSNPKTGKPTTKLRVIGVTVDGKATTKKIGELSPIERKYFADLHKIIDDVFAEAQSSNDWNWSQLAQHAGIAYQTVANLGDRATKYPRFLTIYRLAKAVGWELVMQEPKKSKAKLKVG